MEKIIYKVLSMGLKNKEYYFGTKQSTISFLKKEIIKREYRKVYSRYTGKWEEDPDRDIYEIRFDNKIRKMVEEEKYEKVSPYFGLYLTKHKIRY